MTGSSNATENREVGAADVVEHTAEYLFLTPFVAAISVLMGIFFLAGAFHVSPSYSNYTDGWLSLTPEGQPEVPGLAAFIVCLISSVWSLSRRARGLETSEEEPGLRTLAYFSLVFSLYRLVMAHIAGRTSSVLATWALAAALVTYSLRAGRRDVERRHALRARRASLPSFYQCYLNSEAWTEMKRKALEAAGYRCQVCYSAKQPLEVHHRTYERLGDELPSDLIVLCGDCHGLFHDARISRTTD